MTCTQTGSCELGFHTFSWPCVYAPGSAPPRPREATLVDHRPPEAQLASKELADRHERLSAAIHEWAAGDDELGWPGDPVLQDVGNCDDLAAFLQERGLAP